MNNARLRRRTVLSCLGLAAGLCASFGLFAYARSRPAIDGAPAP